MGDALTSSNAPDIGDAYRQPRYVSCVSAADSAKDAGTHVGDRPRNGAKMGRARVTRMDRARVIYVETVRETGGWHVVHRGQCMGTRAQEDKAGYPKGCVNRVAS